MRVIEGSRGGNMITVLDIDIDLFVDPLPTGPLVRTGRRAEGVEAWRPEKVVDFMQTWLGLNSDRRIPGRVFETHEEILDALAELQSPVHLYHLDAHADLGIGQDCYRFYSDFLAIERSLRPSRLCEFNPRQGDFLLYAIACDFVGSIDYVTHPEVFAYCPDIPIGMDRWTDKYTDGYLDLRRFCGTSLEYSTRSTEQELDCSIPLRMFNRDEFRPPTVSFDCMFITRSPDFTPRMSDRVVDRLQNKFLDS